MDWIGNQSNIRKMAQKRRQLLFIEKWWQHSGSIIDNFKLGLA
jgi:hypothetical protein